MATLKQTKALILTPGASADRTHATLVMLEKALPELNVVRLTLATTSINSAAKKIRAAGEKLASKLAIEPEQIAYGGRSFGGRACSVCVAEAMPASALVMLSYPLHPPGKTYKLRVDHFTQINVPTLFISGDKDPFGTPAEFKKHIKKIPGTSRFHTVTGNHSPGSGQNDAIVDHVRKFLKL